MYAVNRTLAASRLCRSTSVNPTHLLLRALYGVAGLGAVVSLYTRLLALIDDPMPAAILTLTAAMLFLAATSRPERRR